MTWEEVVSNPADAEVMRNLPKKARPAYVAQRRLGISTPNEASMKYYNITKKILQFYPFVAAAAALVLSAILGNIFIAVFAAGFTLLWCLLVCKILRDDISYDIFSPITGTVRRWIDVIIGMGLCGMKLTISGLTINGEAVDKVTINLPVNILAMIILFVLLACIISSRREDNASFGAMDKAAQDSMRADYKRLLNEERKNQKLYKL